MRIHFTNGLYHFIAIHFRHVQVYEQHIVFIFVKSIYSFSSILRFIYYHSPFLKKAAGDLPVHMAIISY